jgi:ubiquinone/menaquinone biosynthesis C-methylase UbiE
MAEEFYKTKRDSGLYKTCWNIYPKLLKKIFIKNDEKILDAGCGNGELGKFLKIKNLCGFDANGDSVKEAMKAGNYKFVKKGSIYDIPFKSKEFDRAICIEVLEYLAEPDKAFRELARVARKEVIISSANFNWYKLKAFFSRKWREQYRGQIAMNENFINANFFRELARKNSMKIKIFYVSNRAGFLRNNFGNWLASEVIGIFELK